LKTQYSFIQSCILQQVINHNDISQQVTWLAILHSTTTWNKTDKKKIEDWLKVRLNIDEIKLFFE
jgi:hypothetical protein